MKTKEKVKEAAKYFRLVKTERNMFSVEEVTIEDSKVINTIRTDETYLPIAFDKLRRATGESFFKAVQDNL